MDGGRNIETMADKDLSKDEGVDVHTDRQDRERGNFRETREMKVRDKIRVGKV